MLKLSFPVSAESMSPKQRWTALVVLSVSLLVVMMDMTILIMALPDLVKDLGTTSVQQLWIVDIYSLILAGMLIPMSALADRWGRKRVLLTGFAIFGLISLLVTFVDSSEQVIALRALLGAAGAMIMPTTLSMLRTIFQNPKERATALAVWSAVSAAGAIIGPIVGGALLEYFAWQATFLINVPFAALAVLAGVFLLPEARNANAARWDMLATVLSMAGMVALVWSIKEFAKEGLGDSVSWMVLTFAVILLVGFVIRCLRSSDPLLDVRLFKNNAFTAGTIAALISMFAMNAMLLLVVQWLQVVEGLSPFKAGVYLLPMALGSLLFAPLAPMLAAQMGARTILSSGLALAGVGFLIMFFFGQPLAYPLLAASLFLIGAGSSSLAIASAIIMLSAPQEKAGNAAAIEESMYDLGGVLGIAILGSIAAQLYRNYLNVDSFINQGISGPLAELAKESIVGALEVSAQMGIAGFAAEAVSAFNNSLVTTGLIGGIIMIVIATVVFMLVPKTLDITKEHH
ncbi:QacA/B family quaternary ammonium compound efflux MFS transporter [Cohnella sp. CIP 111063]|uniref:MFS transporter n=1 Tax=unclassified Cohnella TaxID=2636738 RepID=UPI000B9D3869|nr:MULTISPECIES: MFS transporter [unclassified Cohnella]OXS56979.1 QacA/B family quaternary ammonium compound efflux MFS transporter [Cohnella sp. CIP 111063]PRX69832.1 DHA2 family multidrug resistance protein-like MFS transporter [Cohnella sp. SGD-V74]